ncbi:MAG: 3'-5' exonuclease domain-containing protein 2 [Hydrogenophaga sp.]|uniref:3'-5' exonuclease n=1 Tax=Hydrogenophaga sp. TaxID=1904254 RepID=UPI001D9CF903|nr:3'-5' exonuclease [Hydrogenophaga sp.]MBX3609782.1 3'-5' exonuclease domain-containing protein 2 [Hydrogenophaga sp.]
MTQRETQPTPSKEAIDALPPFPSLDLAAITLVQTAAQAQAAARALQDDGWWGFDTESRPTFLKDQVSDGPHVVQLATLNHAWVFLLHDTACRTEVARLLALPTTRKAGFGLRDDQLRIRSKLGVEAAGVLELNAVFRERGYRKDMGVKAAVAVLFGQRFAKSKKAATSNWSARTLSESQILYAANDAWAARKVAQALGLG